MKKVSKKKLIKMQELKVTDLLIGMVTISPDPEKHYFFADIDCVSEKVVKNRVGNLIRKFKTGHIYIVRSGKGWHLVSFSKPVDLDTYVKMLKFVKADPQFIAWIKKVKYGVLRMSRRSSHMQVPVFNSVFMSPFCRRENELLRTMYLSLLRYENNIGTVRRVGVMS